MCGPILTVIGVFPLVAAATRPTKISFPCLPTHQSHTHASAVTQSLHEAYSAVRTLHIPTHLPCLSQVVYNAVRRGIFNDSITCTAPYDGHTRYRTHLRLSWKEKKEKCVGRLTWLLVASERHHLVPRDQGAPSPLGVASLPRLKIQDRFLLQETAAGHSRGVLPALVACSTGWLCDQQTPLCDMARIVSFACDKVRFYISMIPQIYKKQV